MGRERKKEREEFQIGFMLHVGDNFEKSKGKAVQSTNSTLPNFICSRSSYYISHALFLFTH